MDGSEFVRGVMRRLGVTTAAELAEKMGWKRGAERNVAKWLAGQNEPSFGYVMEMVEKAGLLNASVDGVVRLEPREDPLAPAERQQLAENDASILENQEEAMKLLQAIHAAVVLGDEGGHSAATHSPRK